MNPQPSPAVVDQFAAELKAAGFVEVQTRDLPGGTHNGLHNHPFEVRALMLDGELALSVQGHTTRYRSGEVFTLGAGCEHSEQVGDTPARYLVGRKYP